MNTIIAENAKVAALFAQASNANSLGFRQYRGKNHIITWTDGIPLNQKAIVNGMDDIRFLLTDEQSAWLAIIKIAVASGDRIYIATDSRDSAFWLLSFMTRNEIHDKVTRIHVREMTVKGVRESFDNIEDIGNVMIGMTADMLRKKTDFLIEHETGSLIAKACGTEAYRLGRIRTPILEKIADRYRQRNDIRQNSEYRVNFALEHQGKVFRFASQESWDMPADANQLYIRLKTSNDPVVITKVGCDIHQEHPPRLFNMASLLQTANKRYDLTLEETVTSAQRLYEWGLVTYPFCVADCTSFRKVHKIRQLLDILSANDTFGVYASRIGKLSQGSLCKRPSRGHHGIMITGMSTGHVAHKMSYADKATYELICTRMIEAFSKPAVFQTVTAEAVIAGHTFLMNEEYMLHKGWKAIAERKEGKDEAVDGDQMWSTGSKVHFHAVSVTKRTNGFGNLYSERELLKVATDCKLGTTTEIVNALSELIAGGYAYRSDMGLKPTEKGLALYSVIKGQPIADIQLMSTLERDILNGKLDNMEYSHHHPGLKVYESAVSALAESPTLFPDKDRYVLNRQ